MAETIRELVSEKAVDERIVELGKQISKDYEGKQVHLICVLKGGVFFMCELAKRISVPVSMDFMSVSSYGDDTKSSGVVKIVKDLDEAIEGKEKFIETTHLVDKVFDPALNIQHTEDIIINHLDAAENQYKQKLKEINLGEITNYVHQNSI